MLCAVDERPLVSVPVVIVSTTRQGGCTCENISGLRIGTYNLEFTALHAPKPLLLISADDATRTMPERGFPELRQHYRILGAIQNVSHVALLQFPHNYNYVSRAAMYRWLNRHLDLGFEEPIVESSYKRLTREELSVWDDQHPRPECVPDFELRLLEWLTSDAERQIAGLVPQDSESLQRYRQVVGGAWDILLRNLPENPEIRFEPMKSADQGKYRETLGLLCYRSIEDHHAKLPMVVLTPKETTQQTVIWTDEQGKSGLYKSDGSVKSHIQSLLNAGVTDDILAVIASLRRNDFETNLIDVVGLNGTGPLVAAAVAQAQGAIARAAIDTARFRFANLKDVYDVSFVPGAAKYDDLPGVLALLAPTRLWLAGEGKEAPSIVRAAYVAAGEGTNLTTFAGEARDAVNVAVEWLLRQ